jgi:hypothetical protein
VIDLIALALLEGAAKALGQRLVAGRSDAVDIKLLVTEVAELKQQNGDLLASVDRQESALRALTAVLGRVDGLTVDGDSVRFESKQGGGLGTSLYQLDEEIADLRRQVTPSSPAQRTAHPNGRPRQSGRSSALDGLDEEIARERAGATDDDD